MYSLDPKTQLAPGTYRMVFKLVFYPQSCDFLKPDQVFAGKRFEYNFIPVQGRNSPCEPVRDRSCLFLRIGFFL